MTKRYLIVRRWPAIAMFFCCGAVAASDAALFASNEVISLTIEAPLGALFNDQHEEPEDREAILRYVDEDGVEHSLDIGVQPRGKTRRKPRVCGFPPLRLNFQAEKTTGTVFDGQNKLKLVTHCRDNDSLYQQYVIHEYLVYRMLNVLTERSFRARLLNVTYVSTDSDRTPLTGWAFLIEDREQMAARNGYRYLERQVIEWHQLDPEAANLYAVFQYLIGNTDWSYQSAPRGNPCCHNTVLMTRDEGGLVPVPYDFDFAGIIDTSYAVPGRGLEIRSVRTRLYRGFCRPPEALQATLAHFREHRDAIYELYRRQSGLSEPVRKRSLNYMDRFYKTIDRPKLMERRLIRACRPGVLPS